MAPRLILPILLILTCIYSCQREDPISQQSLSGLSAKVSAKESKIDFPGTLAGAKALLNQFLDPNTDKAALSVKLRPKLPDFKAVFKKDSVKKAYQGYQGPWDGGKIVIRGNPGQTDLLLWSATTEELLQGKGDSGHFPTGYEKAAPHFRPGLTFYRFKFVRPGESLGFAWDGLVYVNEHWVIFPKPWRVLL